MSMIAMPDAASSSMMLVHLGLGADVDAPGRLVEDQHRRLGVEPLGEHRLLLVAARELADRLGSAAVRMPSRWRNRSAGALLGRRSIRPSRLR